MKRPVFMRAADERIPSWIHATSIGAFTCFLLADAYSKVLTNWLPPYLSTGAKAVAGVLVLLYFFVLSKTLAIRVVDWLDRRFTSTLSLTIVAFSGFIAYCSFLAAYFYAAAELQPLIPDPVEYIVTVCLVVGIVFSLVFGFTLHGAIRDRWPDGLRKPKRRSE